MVLMDVAGSSRAAGWLAPASTQPPCEVPLTNPRSEAFPPSIWGAAGIGRARLLTFAATRKGSQGRRAGRQARPLS